jgi:hypothetical protein
LHEPYYGPREIVVNDYSAVLEILALAKDIRGHEDAKLIFRCDSLALFIALRAKPISE